MTSVTPLSLNTVPETTGATITTLKPKSPTISWWRKLLSRKKNHKNMTTRNKREETAVVNPIVTEFVDDSILPDESNITTATSTATATTAATTTTAATSTIGDIDSNIDPVSPGQTADKDTPAIIVAEPSITPSHNSTVIQTRSSSNLDTISDIDEVPELVQIETPGSVKTPDELLSNIEDPKRSNGTEAASYFETNPYLINSKPIAISPYPISISRPVYNRANSNISSIYASTSNVQLDIESFNSSPTKNSPISSPSRSRISLKRLSTGTLNLARSLSINTSHGQSSIYADRQDASSVPSFCDSLILGVPLTKSLEMASISISLYDSNRQKFVFGHVPVTVAKCGYFLKTNATKVEGIFRKSGSVKRIKELQTLFNTAPDFGKLLLLNDTESNYTTHDVANVLKRFLSSLPEPIIPLDFYDKFREVLAESDPILTFLDNKAVQKNSSTSSLALSVESNNTEFSQSPDLNAREHTLEETKLANQEDEEEQEQQPEEEEREEEEEEDEEEFSIIEDDMSIKDDSLQEEISRAISMFTSLIFELPKANRQLLMYIIDLLAVFAQNSKDNLMPAKNLAAIFQPSCLSHPNHDLSPTDYYLSRNILEFLIDYSKDFLSAVELAAMEEHENNLLRGIDDSNSDYISIQSSSSLSPIQLEQNCHSEFSSSDISLSASSPKVTRANTILSSLKRVKTFSVSPSASTNRLSSYLSSRSSPSASDL